MNIVIFGAGAIGSLYGALLSKENTVTLIGRTAHVNAIRKNGLTVEGMTRLNVKILAKETPNDFSLGSKIRKLLNCLDSGQTYVDEEVRL